jgi:hypothetical protein
MSLAPGDLAVIVGHAEDSDIDRHYKPYGRHVVLIHVCTCTVCGEYLASLPENGPMWVCSGTPNPYHSIASASLRKIPPAPMDEVTPYGEELSA